MKNRIALLFLLVLSLGLAPEPFLAKLDQQIDETYPELEAFYKDLHQHPELSLFEKNTSARLAKEMRQLGFEVTEQFGGYGIVAVLKNGDGPTILYRTDMDALPIIEKTGLDYASEFKMPDEAGKSVATMHACGHDMHMTVWLGTAKMLASMKDQWKGTLMMIGQPAEEIGAGAKLMLDAGLYEKFAVPDYALGLHCSPSLPAGAVGFGKGYTMANTQSVDVIVHGQGAHGAAPHKSIDPVVLASMMVMDMQTIVSRTIPPTESAVLTVGAIEGGTKHNIIPDEVRLKITLRSYKKSVHETLIEGIERVAKGQAIAAGLPPEKYPEVIVSEKFTPANYNDPSLVDKLVGISGETLGKAQVLEAEPQMVGEDFSRYGSTKEDVPAVLFWLGTVSEKRLTQFEEKGVDPPGLHSPFYYPDLENTIKTGVKTMSNAVVRLSNE